MLEASYDAYLEFHETSGLYLEAESKSGCKIKSSEAILIGFE
jgi:hypothetical protein